MTFKLQAQAGSCRRSCGVTPRTISGMPSSSEQDDWGACTFFGRVLKAADITSVRLGSAQCGIAQPCLTLSGQRSKRGAPYGVSCGRERDMAYWSCRPQIIRHPTTLATMVTRASEKVRPHRSRQIFRCAPRSVRHHERPLPWKASRLRDPSAGFWQDVPMGHRSGGSESNRQGTLTITGSNVRLGTEMPVALSRFFI